MPPFHTGGWNVLLTPVLHHGGHIVLSQKFDADEVLNALETYQCNQFMAVPTMLKMMSQSEVFDKVALKKLNYIIVGGEAMPLDLIEIYETQNIAIRQGFGMTEVGPNLTSLHHSRSRDKIGSIGKPNMYVNVKLFDDGGHEVSTGELGELCFAGPIVMPGYWKKQLSENDFHEKIWFRSGDIALIDNEGFLYIKDRKKNMYISGGENVYPAEIERFLRNYPKIEDVIVVGIPDEKWGEVGKAFIKSSVEITKEEVMSYCQGKLSKFKIPKQIVFLANMPLNATGKVDRVALKKM
jgi:fatty-acyl-CoA synthase